METRLADLEAGIARHAGRVQELQAIKEQAEAEREAWLASRVPSASASGEPSVAAPVAEAPVRPERRVIPSPPPEAESVRGAVGSGVGAGEAVAPGTGEEGPDAWAKFWAVAASGRTRVRYPVASAPVAEVSPPAGGEPAEG
jgi:hypothetical protein